MLLSRFLMNYLMLTLWAADTGDGGGSGGDGTTPTDGGNGSGDNGATGGTDGAPGERTFTQADLDRVAGQTRQQALNKWAKELGFEKPDDIQAIIKAKQEADDKSKSDLEKAQADVDRYKTQAEQTEQRMYSVLLRAAFDRVAANQVADVDLAYLAANDLKLLTSDAGVTVDLDSSKVVGVDKAVEKLLKDKPLLKKVSQAAPPNTGGSEGGTPPPTAPSAEQDAAYRRRFGIKN